MARPASSRRPSRAARDPDATRARILDAATGEFARLGLGGARVDRIAAAAGANKGMLYYYFGGKEALFQAVLESAYARIRTAELELSLLDVPPEAGIKRLVEFTWNYFIAHPEFLSLLNSENLHRARHLKACADIRSMNSPVIETLRTLLARGARTGAFRSGVDPLQLYISIAALAYFYLSNTHTLSAVFGRDLASGEERRRRLAHMIDLVLSFLAARPRGAAATVPMLASVAGS